jgi:DNA mismatch repair protein MutS
MLFQKWIANIPNDIHTPKMFIRWLLNQKEKKKDRIRGEMEDMLNKIRKKMENEEEITMEEQIVLFQESQLENQKDFIKQLYVSIFNELEKKEDNYKTNYNKSFYEDLEIFENFSSHSNNENINLNKNLHEFDENKEKEKEETETFFQRINYTQTQFGEIFLEYLLKHPTTNPTILLNRKNSLEIFQKYPFLYHQIQSKLQKYKNLEKDILWFYQDIDQYRKNIYDIIYFNYPYVSSFNHFINSQSSILLMIQVYKIFLSPIFTIMVPIMSFLIPIIIWKMTKSTIPFRVLWKFLFKLIFQSIWSTESITTIFTAVFSISIWIFFYIQSFYSTITIAKQTHQIIKIIHQKMHSLHSWIYMIDDIYTICKMNSIHSYPITMSQKDTELEESIKWMKNVVRHSVFRDEKCKLINHKGEILKGYFLFLKNKEKMLPLFQFLSELDTLQSIYTLYEKEKYEFAEWMNISKQPIIKIKNMWHPYFSKDNYITNSIQMKKENIRLITGPNAGGKSTFIKSLMTSILLSQTLTIVPCKKFQITPFSYLYTYLHIPDIKGKQSLFQAEMYRNRDYLEHLEKNKKEGKYTLMIMDELFSSTNYCEGVSGAYSILKKISDYNNHKTITTTHYQELIKLEKDTKKKVRNYYFDVKGNNIEGKNIEYTYKMKKGWNKKRIAIELLKRENFDEEIIKNAVAMYEKMKKKEKKQ